MCIRFLYHGDDVITGFNFDIDLSVWDHKVIVEKDRFYIGILRPDGIRHSYHGVSRNGNAGTLLYVQGNPAGAYRKDSRCMTIADLTEQFIREKISFDDALQIVREKEIVYAPDATMQAMLSDARGRVLVVEPGIGFLEESGRFSLIANDSLLARKGAGGAAALGAVYCIRRVFCSSRRQPGGHLGDPCFLCLFRRGTCRLLRGKQPVPVGFQI